MEKTLFLTAEEERTFRGIPAALREGWQVTEETLKSYESLRQIAMRYSMADFSRYPAIGKAVETIANGNPPKTFSLDGIEADVLRELLFTIGARGVGALMETLLRELKTDEDVSALATLGIARHKLLELNAFSIHS